MNFTDIDYPISGREPGYLFEQLCQRQLARPEPLAGMFAGCFVAEHSVHKQHELVANQSIFWWS